MPQRLLASRARRRSLIPYLALIILVRLAILGRTLVNVASASSGDTEFYYQISQLIEAGQYPFVHFWMEYPPVFPLLLTGFARLVALVGVTGLYQFQVAFAVLMSIVDLINLALVYRLVRRAHGEVAARFAALIYAGCPAVVWFSVGWFDAVAVLLGLLALDALVERRATTAGIWIGLGVLTKIFPGVLLLAAPAALGWWATGRLVGVMLGTIGIIVLPLAWARPDMLLASLASMATRGPWETLPALLTGYYGWGEQPPLDSRFSSATAFVSSRGPSMLSLAPELVLVLAIWGGWILKQRRYVGSRDLHILAGLAIATFVLGNKGFSPQFVLWLIPFVLLVWPNTFGLAYVALLSIHTLAYSQIVFPAMTQVYGDGLARPDQIAALVWLSVSVRTGLIAWIVGHLALRIRGGAKALQTAQAG